jgi:hypothetical protein
MLLVVNNFSVLADWLHKITTSFSNNGHCHKKNEVLSVFCHLLSEKSKMKDENRHNFALTFSNNPV